MELKKNDLIEIEYDLYANQRLYQTTDAKKGKEFNIKAEKFEPQLMFVGHEFMLKALDDDLLKGSNDKEKILELSVKEAYGPRRKDMIKVFPKSAFDEHKMRPVVGVVYDFNGMFGKVKSIIGGRIMVDFNNPLAGKEIKLVYKVKSKVDDIAKKVSFLLESVLKIPTNMFKVEVKEKDLILKIPEQLHMLKEQINKTIEEFVVEAKNYSLKIENFKKQ